MGHRPALIALVGASLVLPACTSSKHAAPAASALGSSASTSSAAASSPAAVASSAASVSASTAASTSAAASSTSAATSSATPSATPSPSATAPAFPTAIWPTYHHDVARTGNAGAVPTVTGLKVAARASLDGAIYASPLVLHDPKGDLVIAATENNTLYA